MDFSDKEQRNAFELISKRYFERNFGTMSKTDFETLLFHIYLEHLLDSNQPFDDYTMSKTLGISQSKIRNLKVRKELQYPRQGFNWKENFAQYISKATYDNTSRTLKVLITDINVMTELRYYFECNGWFDEYHLNPKLFQCRLDFFLKLCINLGEQISLDKATEKKLQELTKQDNSKKEKNAIQKIVNGAVEEGLKELALSGTKEVLVGVLDSIPFGGVAAKLISVLVDILKR